MTSKIPDDNDDAPRCNCGFENNEVLKELLETAQHKLVDEERMHDQTKSNVTRLRNEQDILKKKIDDLSASLEERFAEIALLHHNIPRQRDDDVGDNDAPQLQMPNGAADPSVFEITPITLIMLAENGKLEKRCANLMCQLRDVTKLLTDARATIEELRREGWIKDDKLTEALRNLQTIEKLREEIAVKGVALTAARRSLEEKQALNVSHLEERAKELAATAVVAAQEQVQRISAEFNERDLKSSDLFDCCIHEWEEANARHNREKEILEEQEIILMHDINDLDEKCQAQNDTVHDLRGQVKVLMYLLSLPRSTGQ